MKYYWISAEGCSEYMERLHSDLIESGDTVCKIYLTKEEAVIDLAKLVLDEDETIDEYVIYESETDDFDHAI